MELVAICRGAGRLAVAEGAAKGGAAAAERAAAGSDGVGEAAMRWGSAPRFIVGMLSGAGRAKASPCSLARAAAARDTPERAL